MCAPDASVITLGSFILPSLTHTKCRTSGGNPANHHEMAWHVTSDGNHTRGGSDYLSAGSEIKQLDGSEKEEVIR